MTAADRTWAGPGTMVAKAPTCIKEALRLWEVKEYHGEWGRERDRLLELHPSFPGIGLFSRLVGRVPLGTVLERKGVREEWTLFRRRS